LRFSVPFRFNAGQQISAGFSFRIPFFTCSGDYTVTISVFSGTTLLASSTASLTVN
jgi:hypothetical protein